MSEKESQRPKVFISYSWTNAEHVENIIALAKRLSEDDGIHVLLDQWDLRHGHDRFAFMEKAVTDKSVHKVLIISDSVYAQKANAKKGGVGTESQIISPELYGKVNQTKFIPIAWERNDSDEFTLPAFLKHLYPIDFTTAQKRFENHEQLVRVIYDKPLHVRPAIGNSPAFITGEGRRFAPPSGKFEGFKNAALQDRTITISLGHEYLNAFQKGLEQFRLAPESGVEFDDLVIRSIEEFLPWRDQLLDFVGLLAELNRPLESMKLLVGFLERLLTYKYPPEGMNSYNEAWFDNFDFLIHELFLSVGAMLFARGKYKEVDYILGNSYLAPKALRGYGGDPLGTYDLFYGSPQTLEDRNRRLGLRRISLTADLLCKRATHQDITSTILIECDLICYLRAVISGVRWYPITSVFLENRPHLEFFVRCRTEEGLQNLCAMLGVGGKDELIRKLTDSGNDSSRKWNHLNHSYGFGIDLLKVLAMEKWGEQRSPRIA